MQENPDAWKEIIANFAKISIPVLFLSAARAVLLVTDRKMSIPNAIISCLTGIIISVGITYPLMEVLSNFWQLVLSSTLALAGENILRAIIYKNDWNVIIDALFDHILSILKIKKK